MKKKEVLAYNKLENKVAAVWTRVSSQDQYNKNCSLETQREVCEQYASNHNIKIKKYFGDTFESAKTEGKQYKQMISDVARDKEINVILVYSFDRFSRAGDEAIMTKAYLRSKGIYVISATQATDPDSAAGQLMENMLFLFNQFENQMRRDKTYGGTIASLRRGDYCLQVPLGYSRHKEGKKLIMEINEQGKILRNAWIWRAQGMGENEICDRLNSLGLKIKYKQLNKILKKVIYCGYIEHKELEEGRVKGNFEPLIDEDTFNIANGIGHTGYEKKDVNEMYPLKGHVRCADCGALLTAYEAKQRHIHYYKCNTKHCKNNQSLKIMHALYTEFLKEYQLKKEFYPLLRKVIHNELAVYDEHQEELIKRMKSNKTEIANQIKKVQVRWGLGDIDKTTYEVTLQTLQSELAKINEQLSSSAQSLSNIDAIANHACVIASNISNLWNEGDYQIKVDLQNLLFPEGILWDRNIGDYRTEKTNLVFETIHELSSDYEGNKTKNDLDFPSKSLSVEKRRLERPTPTSRT